MTIPMTWDGTLYTCSPTVAPPRAMGAVISYSQRDESWSNNRMGGTTQTIGSAGCAMVTACMVLSQRLPDITPTEFNRALNVRGGYNVIEGEAHLAWDRLPTIYPELQWLGRESWTRPLYDGELDRVRGFIEEAPLPLWVDFRPLTSRLDTHFVLAVAWDAEHDDIVVIDPWGGVTAGLLDRYAAPSHNLARAIWGYRRLAAR